jgi:hypothetical protein
MPPIANDGGETVSAQRQDHHNDEKTQAHDSSKQGVPTPLKSSLEICLNFLLPSEERWDIKTIAFSPSGDSARRQYRIIMQNNKCVLRVALVKLSRVLIHRMR